MSENLKISVGGQALMEGVMMRSPNFYAMAVRRTTDKKIVTERRAYTSLTRRSKFWALPILRGMAVLYESMKLGMEALLFSNKVLIDEMDEKAKGERLVPLSGSPPSCCSTQRSLAKLRVPLRDPRDPKLHAPSCAQLFEPHVLKFKHPKTEISEKDSSGKTFLNGLFLTLYFMVAFGVAIFLFKFAPLWVAEQASTLSPIVEEKYWLFNAIDGAMKIVIFVGYLLLISLLPDIRRVFAYHGAEHQAIWAYEKGKSLTIPHAQAEHPEHPRCGTSFLILVLLLSIAVYTALPSEASFWGKLGERIAALPLIAGLSYEVLKFSAKYETHWWMRWVTLPGLWLQKITTKKPTDDMEEVAIAALEEVLEAEGAQAN